MSPLAQAFLSREPTLIGRVAGVCFYEHPNFGDEAPLIAITRDGRKVRTGYYDLPTIREVIEDGDLT